MILFDCLEKIRINVTGSNMPINSLSTDWARPIWPADAFPLVLQRREARGCAAALLTFRLQGGADAPPDAISFAAGQYLPLLMEIDR